MECALCLNVFEYESSKINCEANDKYVIKINNVIKLNCNLHVTIKMSSRKPVVTGDQPCRRGNDSFPNGTSAGENSHRTVARADERLTGATDVLVHVTDILNHCKVLVSPPYKIVYQQFAL